MPTTSVRRRISFFNLSCGLLDRDLPLGTVDLSVVAAAERPHLVGFATLDRSYFTVVRPANAAVFEIVP